MALTNAVVGTRVRYTGSTMSGTLHLDDLGTVVAVVSGWASIYILMDTPRNQSTSTVIANGSDVSYHWHDSESTSCWDVVDSSSLSEGHWAVTTGENGFGYDIPVGTRVLLGRHDSSDDSFLVQTQEAVNEGVTGKWHHRRDLAPAAAPVVVEVETLAEFRVRFMVAAHERGVANGSLHSAEVTAALDNLARVEYMDPSPDLDSFKRRVVALALDAKAQYTWCPEPENFLRSIGLGDLLPVKKTVRVVVEVEVTGQSTFGRDDWRQAARQAVRDGAAAGNLVMTVPVPSTRISNPDL